LYMYEYGRKNKERFFLLFIPYMAFHFFFPLLLSQGRVLQKKIKD